MATPAAAARRGDKLSFLTKLAFGSGDLGPAVASAITSFFLLFFLTDVAQLSPAWAGTVLLINKIWDAVNDPLIGWLSDRTRSRWGRRRPWMLLGALPFGLTFFLLWLVPPLGAGGKFVYYLVVSVLFDLGYTVVNVPYVALTPELTPDYDERTSLNSYRFAFSVGGGVIAAALHPLIVGLFADVRTGYAVSAAIWATVCAVPYIFAFLGTFERPEHCTGEATPGEATSPLRSALEALRSRPYRYVMGIYMLSWLAVQVTATVLVYFVTYWMHMQGELSLVLLTIQGSCFIWLFIWSAVSRRIGKREVYLVGMGFWIAAELVLFFITPTMKVAVYLLGALAGVGLSTAYLIPWSMMPDIMEYDELETGQQRAGIFYGFMVFLQKLGLAVGLFLVGQALSLAGYITPTAAVPVPVQPASALLAIRLIVGPAPAVVLALSMVLAYRFPITRERHAAIRAELERRRAGA